MKASEKLLLVLTVGLGVAFGAAHLGGLGRQAKPSLAAPVDQSPGRAAAAAASPSTLELLVTKRAPLRPLPAGARDPFQPVAAKPGAQCLVVGIKVTGILGETEPLTALVKGERIEADTPTDGLKLLRVSPDERAVKPLLDGLYVRAGQRIGGLSVVRVTPRGVEFRYDDEAFFVELFKPPPPPKAGGEPKHGASGTGSPPR